MSKLYSPKLLYIFKNIWKNDEIDMIFNEIMMPIKMLIPYNILNQNTLFIDKFFEHSKESCEFDETTYSKRTYYTNYKHFEYFLINHKNIAIKCLNTLIAHNNYNFIYDILDEGIYDGNMFIINTFYKEVNNIKEIFETYFLKCVPIKIDCIDFALQYFSEKINADIASEIILCSGFDKSILQKFTLLDVYGKMIKNNDMGYPVQVAKMIMIHIICRYYEWDFDKYYEQLAILIQYIDPNTFFDESTISYIVNHDCEEFEFEKNKSLSKEINLIIKKILVINKIYYDKQDENDTKNIPKTQLKKYNLTNKDGVMQAINKNYKYFNLIPGTLQEQYKEDYSIMYALYKSNGNAESIIPYKFLPQIYVDYIMETKQLKNI